MKHLPLFLHLAFAIAILTQCKEPIIETEIPSIIETPTPAEPSDTISPTPSEKEEEKEEPKHEDPITPEAPKILRYAYSELNEADRKIYDFILDQILACNIVDDPTDIINKHLYLDFKANGFQGITSDKVMNITGKIMRDCPEIFYISNYIPRESKNPDLGQFYLRVLKTYTPELYRSQLEQINQKVDALLEKVPADADDYHKILTLYTELVKIFSYGDMNGLDAGIMVGPYINGKSVCEGIARAFLYLCQKANINAIYVTGDSQGQSHAWNLIELNGKWYSIDATWARMNAYMPVGYLYFLLGQDSFDKNYSFIQSNNINENLTTAAYNSLPALAKDDYPRPEEL